MRLLLLLLLTSCASAPVPCVCECVASQQRKLDVGPGHPYTGPSVWPASYVCSACGKRFELKSYRLSCLVNHQIGECCHFGETEVKE